MIVIYRMKIKKVKQIRGFLQSWRNWYTRMIQVHVFARKCGFKSHRSHQKRRDTRSCASSFLVRHFCCAKVVACGRMTEREWGNPQRFPPHTLPSLRYVEVRTTKPVGNHRKATLKGGFSFWRGQ